jgi:hypothetical protein
MAWPGQRGGRLAQPARRTHVERVPAGSSSRPGSRIARSIKDAGANVGEGATAARIDVQLSQLHDLDELERAGMLTVAEVAQLTARILEANQLGGAIGSRSPCDWLSL